jgi:hypothetical protein
MSVSMPQPVSGYGERDKISAEVFRGIFRLQSNVPGPDRDRSSVRHRVAGIDDQVDQGELQFMNIYGHRPDIPADIDRQIDITADGAGQKIPEGGEALAQTDHCRVQWLAPRKGEKLPGQPLAPRRGTLDRLDCTQVPRIGDPLLQKLRIAAHHHDHVVEVMRCAARQLAQRLHFLGLGQLLLRVP